MDKKDIAFVRYAAAWLRMNGVDISASTPDELFDMYAMLPAPPVSLAEWASIRGDEAAPELQVEREIVQNTLVFGGK
jgi:hypothetical protein